MSKCTLLKDTLYPKDKNKRYSPRFVIDLIVNHIPNCDDCSEFYEVWFRTYRFGWFWRTLK